MDKRVTVNVPDAPPDEHDGEDLMMSADDHGRLTITVRTPLVQQGVTRADRYEVLAIYAQGFWADARIEDLES